MSYFGVLHNCFLKNSCTIPTFSSTDSASFINKACIIPDRISGNRIYVGNDDDWRMQTVCANITSTDTIQTVRCNTGMPVRFLTIRHDSQTQLGFCEVVVNGYQYEGMLCIGVISVILSALHYYMVAMNKCITLYHITCFNYLTYI